MTTPRPRMKTPTPRLSFEELQRRLDAISAWHTPWMRYGERICLDCHNAWPCRTARATTGDITERAPGGAS